MRRRSTYGTWRLLRSQIQLTLASGSRVGDGRLTFRSRNAAQFAVSVDSTQRVARSVRDIADRVKRVSGLRTVNRYGG